MLEFLLFIAASILLIVSALFLLLAPIKYGALLAKKNVLYNEKLNMFYKWYFIGIVIIDIVLLVLYPNVFAGLVVNITIIVVAFLMIQSKRKRGEPFRVLFPVYKQDDVEKSIVEFMDKHKDADFILAANKSPLFIVSRHKTEEAFQLFLDELNTLTGVFEDLNSKGKNLLCKLYPFLILLAAGFVIFYSFILEFLSTL